MRRKRSINRWGFTLVEIMVVLAIIGLLAATAVQAFQRVRAKAQNARFIGDMRSFATAAETYMLSTGSYLEDAESGIVPTGLEQYINPEMWTNGTPLGGKWDMVLDAFGIKAGFGVDSPIASQEQMQQVDEDFDDGDLSTGKFRKISLTRYVYVLEDA